MKIEELRKIANKRKGHTIRDFEDWMISASDHYDALLKVAEAADKAQKQYLKHPGDWFDIDLDEALKELEEIE